MLQSSQEIFNAVIASALLMIMLVTIILFATAKYFRKQQAYQEIENLLRKQELQSAYATIEGRESERKRIAEDLHDSMGSILHSLRIYSDLIMENSPNEETQRLAGKLSELTEQTANETRRISHELGASTLKHMGLQEPIQQLCQAIRDSQKVEVISTVSVQSSLANELTLNIYRVVQELLTNTLKHAKATKIRLELAEIANDYLSLIFEDNGQGFDAASVKAGMGLQNLRARVERFQGTITFDSNPTHGTTVIIEIPLR